MSEQNRKVLRVEYISESYFAIPKGIDLEDDTTYKSYIVKYNTLYITLLNGKEIEIQSAWDCAADTKYPSSEDHIEQEDTSLEDEEFEKVDKLLEE